MTPAEKAAILTVVRSLLETAESIARLSKVSPDLLERDYITSTLSAVAADLVKAGFQLRNVILED